MAVFKFTVNLTKRFIDIRWALHVHKILSDKLDSLFCPP